MIKLVNYNNLFLRLKNYLKKIRLILGTFSHFKDALNYLSIRQALYEDLDKLNKKNKLWFEFFYKTDYIKKGVFFALSKCDRRSLLVMRKGQDHKIRTFLQFSKIIKATNFLDIGANYGEFSIILAEYFKVITSIEPNPLITWYLKKSVIKNGLSNKISIVPKACVLKKQDNLIFSVNPNYSGGNKVFDPYLENKSLDIYKNEYLVEVDTVEIKSIINSMLDQSIDKISAAFKIDIEGKDVEIANEILLNVLDNECRFSGLVVMFEWLGDKDNDELLRLLNKVLKLNFNLIVIPGSLKTYNSLGLKIIKATKDLSNFLNTPNEFLFYKKF